MAPFVPDLSNIFLAVTSTNNALSVCWMLLCDLANSQMQIRPFSGGTEYCVSVDLLAVLDAAAC